MQTLDLKKKHYTTILFDFDGTLTPSLPLWCEAYQWAMSQWGVVFDDEETVRVCFYKPWDEIVSSYKIPSKDEFRAKVREGLEQAFVRAVPFHGVVEFLDDCLSRQTKMAIVTSSNRPFVDSFLKSHNMEKYFLAIVTADDIKNHKPHPEPVHLALSLLESKPEESLIIGDAVVDLQAGHAAGLDRWLFFPHEHSVYYDFKELESHEPHHVFHDYPTLRSLLAKSLAD